MVFIHVFFVGCLVKIGANKMRSTAKGRVGQDIPLVRVKSQVFHWCGWSGLRRCEAPLKGGWERGNWSTFGVSCHFELRSMCAVGGGKKDAKHRCRVVGNEAFSLKISLNLQLVPCRGRSTLGQESTEKRKWYRKQSGADVSSILVGASQRMWSEDCERDKQYNEMM